MYSYVYETPNNFHNLLIESDGEAITKLVFTKKSGQEAENRDIFKDVICWLDSYFKGEKPVTKVNYKLETTSNFQREVLAIVAKVPYGTTMTYGEIAGILERKLGYQKLSAQAVGGAIGRNPLCLLIPCHRILGKGGKITGYSGGISNKMGLLELEKIEYRK